MENNTWMKKVMDIWNAFSKEKKLAVGGATVAALVLVVGLCVGIAVLGKSADTFGTESTQETEDIGTEVFGTEEEEETETTEIEEVVQLMSVAMTATSIEKDLKIKIVDENNELIAGQPFVIIVTPEGESTGTEYNDHDMDGIIYIKSIAAGNYTVQLQELEGFVIAENPISATVKDKIVYEKVEIKNEIKDESQIDASKEDTTIKDVEVENKIEDTLPLLASKVETTEVAKEQVDLSDFPEAKVSADTNDASIATLPKSATLYTVGNDASKTVELKLNVTDTTITIKDILWKVNGSENGTDSGVVEWVVSEDKKAITLTSKAEGTAIVSAVIAYETTDTAQVISEETRTSAAGQTQELTCEVTVGAPTDVTTQLKDLDGNALYLDKEAKTIATPKDYLTAELFYANPQYTGWQTMDGKLYYYKEDHTHATGKQVIGGVIYEFDETGYLIEKAETLGIDVSKWNGDIDWKAVAGAGVDFAIIRCGYRGTSTGVLVEDPYFKANIAGATANGIKVGVYIYSQAITEAEAVEEASMALELVKGYHLQLPIYIDTESSGGRGDNVSKEISAIVPIIKIL